MGGMLGVAVGKVTGNQNMVDAGLAQMAGSYDNNVLGQTADGPAWAKYGTRGALVVSGAATAVAAAAGTAELVFFSNQPILVEGLFGGGNMGSGGLLQLRPQGGPPIIRFDFHPIPEFPSGNPVPHFDSPLLDWHHWPW